MRDSENTLRSTQSELFQTQTEIAELKSIISDLEADKYRSEKSYSEIKVKIENEKEVLSAIILDKENEEKALKAFIVDQTTQINDLNESLRIKTVNGETILAEKERLAEEMVTLNKKCEELQDMQNLSNQKIVKMTNGIEAQLLERNNLARKLEVDTKHFNSIVCQKTNEIENLKATLKDVNENLTSLKSAQNILNCENSELNEKIEQLLAEKKKLTELSETLQNKNSELAKTNEIYLHKNMELSKENNYFLSNSQVFITIRVAFKA